MSMSTKNLSRRALIGGAFSATAATATLAGGGIIPSLAGRGASDAEAVHGDAVILANGRHQAGVTAPATAHTRFLAYTLKPETDRRALTRLFRILTDDIESLTLGVAPVTDTEPELAATPARLTITVGFGPELVRRINAQAVPDWLGPLPAFSRDKLDPAYNGGDLLLIVSADDPTTVAHASRMMLKSVRAFADPLWRQDGFRHARGSHEEDASMRNLMGQVDGTSNPVPDTANFDEVVWHDDGWLAGGTALVLRRIRMELETWDMIDRPVREQAMGRDLAVGAPLTGTLENDEPDFEAKDALGFHVIPDFSHIRRARMSGQQLFRRSINYDDGAEQGLLFVSYQRDPLKQFVPIQNDLDKLDLMNEWITHVGSAVFAIAPGWQEGEQVGDTLMAWQS